MSPVLSFILSWILPIVIFIVIGQLISGWLMKKMVNLIYEHNAGRFFVSLPEQIPHLCRAHSHEHFHEFTPGKSNWPTT